MHKDKFFINIYWASEKVHLPKNKVRPVASLLWLRAYPVVNTPPPPPPPPAIPILLRICCNETFVCLLNYTVNWFFWKYLFLQNGTETCKKFSLLHKKYIICCTVDLKFFEDFHALVILPCMKNFTSISESFEWSARNICLEHCNIILTTSYNFSSAIILLLWNIRLDNVNKFNTAFDQSQYWGKLGSCRIPCSQQAAQYFTVWIIFDLHNKQPVKTWRGLRHDANRHCFVLCLFRTIRSTFRPIFKKYFV